MIYLNEDLCKGCLLCVNVCPRDVYGVSDTLNHKGVRVPIPEQEACIKCQMCTLMCPDQAILVEDD